MKYDSLSGASLCRYVNFVSDAKLLLRVAVRVGDVATILQYHQPLS